MNFPIFYHPQCGCIGIICCRRSYYLKTVIRPDIGLAGKLSDFGNPFADRFVKNYGSQEEEEAGAGKKGQNACSAIGAAFFLSLHAFGV